MTLRHYAKFKNEEVIVLGYRKSMNSVMICRVNYLPADEQAALRQIASSSYAQSSCDYLIPILGVERHKSGEDWFSYLARRLHRNDGSVVVLPLKEVVDMDTDQKNFFKGWGKSVAEARSVREKNEAAQGAGSQIAGENILAEEAPEDYTPITPVVHDVPTPPAPDVPVPMTGVEVPNITEEEAKPYVDREAMMLQLMQQMVAGQQQIAEGMADLKKAVKPVRKTTTKKAVRRKAKPAPAPAPAEEPAAPEVPAPVEE